MIKMAKQEHITRFHPKSLIWIRGGNTRYICTLYQFYFEKGCPWKKRNARQIWNGAWRFRTNCEWWLRCRSTTISTRSGSLQHPNNLVLEEVYWKRQLYCVVSSRYRQSSKQQHFEQIGMGEHVSIEWRTCRLSASLYKYSAVYRYLLGYEDHHSIFSAWFFMGK